MSDTQTPAAAEKLMLLNAIHGDELRVAITSDGRLIDCDFERPRRKQHKGDIIFAEIKHIEPSLDAVFVDIGSPTQRHGFLPFKEVAPEYYLNQPETQAKPTDHQGETTEVGEDEDDSNNSSHERPAIKDVLKEGQKILVQIDKDERGKKGAALTTYISLAGCYMVLMPNNPKAGGISRRVDPNDRHELKEIRAQLQLPEGMGLIVRTAGVGRSLEELQWDLDILLKQWELIQSFAIDPNSAPYLIHQESDIILRTIRDYLRPDIKKIIIDDKDIFESVKKQILMLRPDYADRVELYSDTVSLFTRYGVEKQIETAFLREVRLPSGGAVVIDHTEALTSIDVNSARSTGGGDIEETALHTNLEAAQTIATQLRLRDLGGLVVVDFIDMTPQKNQREVERYFYECLRTDKARIQMGRISRFGLLEMSRQRLRASIEESNQVMCPRCDGQGLIRSVESLSLSIMRFIEEEAMKSAPAEVQPKIYAYVPVDVATYISNEKRADITKIDERYAVSVLIIPNPNFETPHYLIDRVTDSKLKRKPSYKQIEAKDLDRSQLERLGEPPAQILEPIIKAEMVPAVPQPKVSLIKRFLSSIVRHGEDETTSTKSDQPKRRGDGRGKHKGRHHDDRHEARDGDNRDGSKRRHGRGGGRKRGRKPHHDKQHDDNKSQQTKPEPQKETEKAEKSENRQGGNRNRRGRRRRHSGNRQQNTGSAQNNQEQNPTSFMENE